MECSVGRGMRVLDVVRRIRSTGLLQSLSRGPARCFQVSMPASALMTDGKTVPSGARGPRRCLAAAQASGWCEGVIHRLSTWLTACNRLRAPQILKEPGTSAHGPSRALGAKTMFSTRGSADMREA